MSDPVVQIEQVTRYFGTKAALRDVTFSVREGEIYALLGRNGAGKTTLMRILLGLDTPTRGQSRMFGKASIDMTPQIRARVGYLAEGHRLYPWMRIRDLARLTERTHPRWDDARYRSFMEYFQLDVRQKIKTLSNGQRAQVALGIALTCSPDLLIMDDPTLGVDAATRIDVLRGIVDVVSRARCTVLFSTHILADAERICDRIGILHDGVLRADAPVQEFKEKVVRYHMKFGDRIPDRVQLPRLVASTLMDKEVLVTVVSPSDDTEKAISEMGPQSCEPVPLSLEEAFVDYTSPRQTRRLVMGTSSGKEAQTS